MNEAQRKQANQLRERLRANEVVAFNPQNGRCSIFGMGLNRTPETLRRFGWEVVYTHAPAGIKLAAPAQDTPDTMDTTDAPAKKGRKPKQEQP
jgi:hypothetical protein